MNEIGKPTIGLLPLMLELYKTYAPEIAEKQGVFIKTISDEFREFSDVTVAPVCSARADVESAVRDFEMQDVDLIVVLFISYAASIAALNPLSRTRLPLLMFSTSPKGSMAEGMTTEDIMLNHGVHGYMDLANVLRRNGRQFVLVAGKSDDKRAYREIAQWAESARAVKMLRRSVIGLAGYAFDGMGDFGVDTTMLNAVLGPEVRHVPLNLVAGHVGAVSDEDCVREIRRDRETYEISENVDADIHRESNRVYLGLSNTIEELSLHAFTMHFQGILEHPGIKTLPFLAISKLQEKGLAYAGEGDLLGATANLMLRYLCKKVLFTETFCPDFDGGRIVMGHMGESNPAFGERTVLRRKKFAFGDALDPVIADVQMKPEKQATVMNLGIVEENTLQVIVYAGEICARIPGSPDIDMPYFHFRPDVALPELLSRYGLAGGTHHIAMTVGDRREEIRKLAELLCIKTVFLE